MSVQDSMPGGGRQHDDLAGRDFERLHVLRRDDPHGTGRDRWLCRCRCGVEKVVRGKDLRSHGTRSCGCLNRDQARANASRRFRRHGLRNTPEYAARTKMILRCHDPKNSAYANYGGRGIAVCDEWRQSFERFYADMGPRPGPRYTLERIDNNRGYSPDNCRWATYREQSRNTRSNRLITWRGRTMVLADWAAETGLSRYCIAGRIDAGWALERALTTPARQVRKGGPRGGEES